MNIYFLLPLICLQSIQLTQVDYKFTREVNLTNCMFTDNPYLCKDVIHSMFPPIWEDVYFFCQLICIACMFVQAVGYCMKRFDRYQRIPTTSSTTASSTAVTSK